MHSQMKRIIASCLALIMLVIGSVSFGDTLKGESEKMGVIDLFFEEIIFGLFEKNNKEFDNRGIAKGKFEELIYAITNGDGEKVDALFSLNAKDNAQSFPEEVTKLLGYFKGEIVSYNDWSGPSSKGTQEAGKRKRELFSSFDVETTETKYRFAMKYISEDDWDPDNIGIWSIYIIEAKNTDEKYAYRGDREYSPGIHFDIPHIFSSSIENE